MNRIVCTLILLGSLEFCLSAMNASESNTAFGSISADRQPGIIFGGEDQDNTSNQDNKKGDGNQLITEATDNSKHSTAKDTDTSNKTNGLQHEDTSTVHIIASVVGVVVVAIAVGLAVILRRVSVKRHMEELNSTSFHRDDSENPSTPYESMGPKAIIKTNNDNYTNLMEQESGSSSTICSVSNNISMLPSPGIAPAQSLSAVSMPVSSYIPKSRRTMNNEVDSNSKRQSCSEWKVLEMNGVSRAGSQDSGFASTSHIATGSHLTLGSNSNMSASIYSDISAHSQGLTGSLKEFKPETTTKTDFLKTRSLSPGLHGLETAKSPTTLSKLHIPRNTAEYFTTTHEYPESNLMALIEPFLKNPAKFRNRDGQKRTYATMSFAIGAFDTTGGVLSLPNRSVELIIPPHAVEKETVIYFSVVSHNQNKPNEISVTPEIDLGPDGTRFNCPVMLTFQHCSDVNENSSMSYMAMVQEGDRPWREMSSDESMCTLVGNRACLFMDHFSRVKLVIKEGVEPDAASIDENVELEDEKSDDASITTVVPSTNSSSSVDDIVSSICSHNGACACPDRRNQNEKGARPKTLAISKKTSSSSSSLESSAAYSEKKKDGALVRAKRIIQNKLRPISAFRGKTNGVTLNLHLCCFVEKCEQMVKIRVYYATTIGILDDIVMKEHGDQSTTPCSFIFRQGQGSVKFKLDTSNLEMYWPAQTAFEGLPEDHVMCTQYDHVEFTIKPTSVTTGLVKVFQSKRPQEKRKLYPAWGRLETKTLQTKHWMQCIDTDNTDIISHMLATRGVEPVEMVPRKPAIPYRLLMELCKLLDPDERARACLADIIGIDYNESKWIQSRKASYTKVILTFLQGLFYKESSDEVLRKLFVYLKEIKHEQAADVVLEYLRGTSRLRGQSSSSQSSSENDVNNSGNHGGHPPRTQRSDSNQSTNSIASSFSSINTSSSTIANFNVNGQSRNRTLSDTDSGYSPSPSSPPVTTSTIAPGVHIPTYKPYNKADPVMYKVMNSSLAARGVTVATPL